MIINHYNDYHIDPYSNILLLKITYKFIHQYYEFLCYKLFFNQFNLMLLRGNQIVLIYK